MLDEDLLEDRYDKKLEEMDNEYKKPNFEIEDNIYSLAFAALINSDELNRY